MNKKQLFHRIKYAAVRVVSGNGMARRIWNRILSDDAVFDAIIRNERFGRRLRALESNAQQQRPSPPCADGMDVAAAACEPGLYTLRSVLESNAAVDYVAANRGMLRRIVRHNGAIPLLTEEVARFGPALTALLDNPVALAQVEALLRVDRGLAARLQRRFGALEDDAAC